LKKLQTPLTLGLNDHIFQSGNIFKDPSIDIFKLFSIKKRKRRSHGIRKNGIIKRELHQTLSIYRST